MQFILIFKYYLFSVGIRSILQVNLKYFRKNKKLMWNEYVSQCFSYI